MNIAITFKNFEPSDHLRKHANERFKKLDKYVKKTEEIEVTVVLSVVKFRHKADVNISGDGLSISAVEQSEDMYTTVDLVYEKVKAQLIKAIDLRKSKRRGERGESLKSIPIDIFKYYPEGTGDERIIVGSDERFEPKPCYTEEAAMQIAQRDEEFLVFLNAETETINIIYRRKNGQLGLIDIGV